MTEPYYNRESYYSGEYDNEPDEFIPYVEEDEEEEYEQRRNLYDEPPHTPWDEDDPVETDDPYDERGWS